MISILYLSPDEIAFGSKTNVSLSTSHFKKSIGDKVLKHNIVIYIDEHRKKTVLKCRYVGDKLRDIVYILDLDFKLFNEYL